MTLRKALAILAIVLVTLTGCKDTRGNGNPNDKPSKGFDKCINHGLNADC